MIMLLCFFFPHPSSPPLYIVYIEIAPLYKKELFFEEILQCWDSLFQKQKET